MIEREKVSDVMRWYSLMKLIEKKYGIVKVLAPAVGFLVLVRPEYVRLISSELDQEASFELSEQIVRLELAKRLLSDVNHVSIPREEFETLMETNTDEQKVLIEENILPFEKFRKCGFDVSEKSFIDYLARSNARGSVKHTPTSHRHLTMDEEYSPKDNYVVAMDERTLLAYVFPASQRNLKAAFKCLDQLAVSHIQLSYKNLQKLGELFGVDSDPQWSVFLKLIGQNGQNPRDEKFISADSIFAGMSQAQSNHKLLAGVERAASNIWEEQAKEEAERVRQAELLKAAQKRAEEEARRKQELERRKEEERKRQEKEKIEALKKAEKEAIEAAKRAEIDRKYREEVQKKLEEERIAAIKREAEELEKSREMRLREQFIEE